MNKTWTLTINHHPLILTLAPPSSRGFCFKCRLEKEILAISEQKTGDLFLGQRKFCWSCALANLYELEQSDDEFENKKEVIKEIREVLNSQPVINTEDEQPSECYG